MDAESIFGGMIALNLQEVKNQVYRTIDDNAAQIVQLTQELERTPELGFK